MVGPLQAPVDYFSQLAPFDIGQAMDAHKLQGQQLAQAQAQQQRAAQQQAQLDEARAAFAKDPSAQNFSALVTYDPKSYEAIKSAHDAMDTEQRNNSIKEQTAIHGYLAAGRSKEAAALLDRRIAADKAAGLDTADDQEFRDLIDEDPAAAAATVAYHLGSAVGADKFGDVFGKVGDGVRADAELPGKIAATTATTAKTVADARLTVANTDQVAPNAEADRRQKAAQEQRWAAQSRNEAGRLALDADALETNTQLELEKLRAKGTELSAGAEGRLSSAVVNAEGSRQLATRASDLANKIAAAPIGLGGVFASVNEAARGAFGGQNPVSALRKEYSTLINAQAVANLPPGPASDKDIKLAREGFPKGNANAETMASFLRGMAKLQNIKANREQARADWISENGNEGRARKDIMVNGVRVPAGTTFGEFSQSAASVERREDVTERSYMQKYK